MIKLPQSQKELHTCCMLWAWTGFWDRRDRRPKRWDKRWYQAPSMWVASSVLPRHHCFSSLFHFLLLTRSHAKVQSPREISHPVRCVCVCLLVWLCEWVFEGNRDCKQDEREQGERENKIVFHPRAYNSALYLKIDAELKASKEH